VRELSARGLDVNLSVDPTQVGHAVDPALAVVNVRRLADAIVAATAGERRPDAVHRLMLDMEDPGVVAETIALHDSLAAAGLTHDDRLHRHAIALARRNGWRPGEYAFEMLLGVMLARALLS
jgi:hypothetical protein